MIVSIRFIVWLTMAYICLARVLKARRVILQTEVGVVSVKGADCRRFLQGLGTNDFDEAQSGTTFLSAFCNAKGVCLDYARVLCTDNGFRFICQSSSRARTLSVYFEKFLFPLDKVIVKDESSTATLYQIIGEEGESSSIGSSDKVVLTKTHDGKVYGFSEGYFSLPAKSLLVLGEGGMDSMAGIIDVRESDCHMQGKRAKEVSEQLRRLVGRPSVDEDIEPHNATALEAGLMHALHFRKGCFVGNEIVSKQVQTKAVRKHLVGLQCGCGVAKGAFLVEPESGEVAGFVSSGSVPVSEELTSLLSEQTRHRWGRKSPALAYVKTKLAHKGTRLRVAGVDTEEVVVEPLPFPRFAVSASPAPPVEKVKTRGKELRLDLEGNNAGGNTPEEMEAKRKAAKLEAMAARVAAMKEKREKGNP